MERTAAANNAMTDSKPTFLYLIRHGATDANLRRPYILQGRGLDLPLNDIGRSQAERLRRLFQTAKISSIYASPMRRAAETARAVADAHKMPVSTVEALIECDVGRWEGLDWETIRREFPREYEDFQRDPGQCPYYGGESYHDVSLRAIPAVEELLAKHAGETVIAVTHNVVNRVCAARFLGLDVSLAKSIHQVNGGVNVIRRQNERTELIVLNSFFHLEDELRT